jgi:hypothetical protein
MTNPHHDPVRWARLAIFDRFSATQEETLWYYRALADVFLRRMDGKPLARDLSDTVDELVRESAALAGT